MGLVLFFSSLRRFAAEGRGTGEAMLLRSGPHGLWALLFLGINLVYIPLLEEPFLRLRFGAAYGAYCRHVPRLLPRLRPWQPDPTDGDAA